MREITLTFAFFVLTEITASLISIYSYWYLFAKGEPTGGFYFYSGDFNWQGYPGVILVAIPTCIGTEIYESLYSMIFVVIVLMVQPEGIMGAFNKSRTPTEPLRIRIKDYPAKIASMIRQLMR